MGTWLGEMSPIDEKTTSPRKRDTRTRPANEEIGWPAHASPPKYLLGNLCVRVCECVLRQMDQSQFGLIYTLVLLVWKEVIDLTPSFSLDNLIRGIVMTV